MEGRALRQAVLKYRQRELVFRTILEHGSPQELATELIAMKSERLYVAGGDGTVHVAAVALAPDDGERAIPEIAVLPRGTGNDFARALGLFADDWDRLVNEVTGPKTLPVDLGRINGGVFVNAVTMGFGAEATRALPRILKDTAGGVSYAALTAWKAFAANPFNVEFDSGKTRWRGDALALVVMNGHTIGGGMRVGLESRLDDGLLDLAIFPAFTAGELPDVVEDCFKRDADLFEHLRYFQIPAGELRFSREVAVSIDGEPSTGNAFSFQSQRSALRFVASGSD